MTRRARTHASALAAGALAALVAAPGTVGATPQITSDLSVGGGAVVAPEAARDARFSLGARADVLFGPRGPHALRAGPFLALRTDDFDDLVPAAGLSVLVPASPTFPLVLSAGAALDVAAATPRPALLQRVWWGSRTYNYHSAYGLSGGLWIEAREFLDAGGAVDVVAGVDIDLEIFALPWVLLYNWIAR